MNPANRETLSQLMDGEWQDIDAAECVKGICADEQLQSRWARYHLIRDVIKNEPLDIDTDLTNRICSAIADEPSYSNVATLGEHKKKSQDAVTKHSVPAQVPEKSNWRTGVIGLAVAASVALVTVVSLNRFQGEPVIGTSAPQAIAALPITALPQTTEANIIPGQRLPQVDFVANKGSYWVMPDARRSVEAEQRLNRLLSAHIENSPSAERQGMLPYSRLVGYDTLKPE